MANRKRAQSQAIVEAVGLLQAWAAKPLSKKTLVAQVPDSSPRDTGWVSDLEEANYRLWLNRAQVEKLIGSPDLLDALADKLQLIQISQPGVTANEAYGLSLLFLAEAVEVTEIGKRPVLAWQKAGTRTQVLADLKSAQRSCFEARATMAALIPLLPILRGRQRKQARSKKSNVETNLLPIKWEARRSALQVIQNVLTEATQTIQEDLQNKRQQGGKVSKFGDAIFELSSLTDYTFGRGASRGNSSRLIAAILSVVTGKYVDRDAVRKAL
jgi:hypothetical protein